MGQAQGARVRVGGSKAVTFDVPTLQLIAYSAFTFASITVACVSLFLAYRQNFGWKPIILWTRRRLTIKDLPYELSLGFEVWNRRKYPIVIVGQCVGFQKLTFVRTGKPPAKELGTDWDLDERLFENHHSVLLDPNSHHQFSLTTGFETSEPEKAEDVARIVIFYFDPIKNRFLTIRSEKVKFEPMRRGRS
jgi:hypothetical protein